MTVSRQLTDQKIGKDTHTMSKDNVINLKKPEAFVDDPITDILRQGARKLLAQALETEIEIFLNNYKELTDESGHQRIVRNGYLPERNIQTGIGPVPVNAPRVRDRHCEPSDRIRFSSLRSHNPCSLGYADVLMATLLIYIIT